MPDEPIIKVNISALGDLSKPLDTLIRKTFKVLGWIVEPTQIARLTEAETSRMVRLAEAEARVDRIRAENRIAITERQREAVHRWVGEEEKKQANIEAILSKAGPLLEIESSPQDVGDDWIANFFEKSRIISDEEMQQLWARILAGEANKPGAFSKRTVNLLADLDRVDADLFSRLCNFCWQIEGLELQQLKGTNTEERKQHWVPVVLDFTKPIYKNAGLDYKTLGHLGSLGLGRFDDSYEAFWWNDEKAPSVVSYFGRPVTLRFEKRNYPVGGRRNYGFPVGNFLFTRAGYELAPVCGGAPVDGFFELVFEEWGNRGFIGKQEDLKKADLPSIQIQTDPGAQS
jgi:hypothetical protein